MNLDIDGIVKEVLFRIGHLNKAHLISGIVYPEDDLKDFGYVNLIEKMEELQKDTILWLPALSSSQMMSIAAGIPVDELSNWCLYALLKGVKVHVKKERLEFKEDLFEYSPLLKKHIEALELLKSSGLTIIDENQTPSSLKYYDKKILGEKEVLSWSREAVKEVVLGQNTILTPLGEDALRSMQIKWRKE